MIRRRHRRDVVILAYHNIVPKGAEVTGDRSLHLEQDAFARQLDVLARTHEIMPLPLALSAGTARGNLPAAAITFDDAYAGAVTAGVSELARRGLPATIFVAPAFLDGRPFWWDALALEHPLGMPTKIRDRALTKYRGDAAAILADVDSQGALAARVPAHARGAALHDLMSAARISGLTLASHSWSHANLAVLDGPHLAAELTRPLEWLRARFANVLPYVSYPYGLSSPCVEQAAADAQYEAAFLIMGGWLHSPPVAPFAVPRVNIPSGSSIAGFQLRAAGLVR
ncbi:MAG TPA: polysaccharide deacetylase family protein [Gemmatimonadaceae bacterium]|nr:polysaccharide deacetylase family protein [Gemmatimonadaceae bacterium]